MQQVKAGDTVRVHYHGRLTDGTTFDSSEGRDPLEFEVGGGMVIKGFDDGVMGMAVGDKRTIEIPVQDAYGVKDPQILFMAVGDVYTVSTFVSLIPPGLRVRVRSQRHTPAGDHEVVLLRVHALATDPEAAPLVFHGSTFRRLSPARVAA